LQVPPALRPDGALGKFEGFACSGRALFMFADDAVHNSAPLIAPLNTRRTSASAAEAESFFRRTALPRGLNESIVNHNAIFRKRDGTIRQHNPNQTRARFATPTRAKNRRFCHGTGPNLRSPGLFRSFRHGQNATCGCLNALQRNHASAPPADRDVEKSPTSRAARRRRRGLSGRTLRMQIESCKFG